MLKKKQKGAIGPWEVLLVALVVGLIGFVVWRVTASNEMDDSDTSANQSVDNSQSSVSEPTSSDKIDTEDGSRYINETLGFSLPIPENWKSSDEETDYFGNFKLTMTSPDYTALYEELGGGFIETGGIITLVVEPTNDSSLSDRKRSGGPMTEYWENEEYTVGSVDGQESWEYEFDYEFDGPIYVEVVHNGYRYTFTFDGESVNEKDSEHISTFVNVLQGVAFSDNG